MIEKKVGNVTLRLCRDVPHPNVELLVGKTVVSRAWHSDPIPDFGPEITAAIEDLRKPLAENECWGPNGERFRFELRDNDGAGVAKGGSDEAWFHEACIPASEAWRQVMVALRIWAEKERGRWGLVRVPDGLGGPYVAISFDGERGYGVIDKTGFCFSGTIVRVVPTFMRTKAQAEYEAIVRERRPKKPSERLGEALKNVGNPGEASMNELYKILDELAEKVGGL